MNNPRQNSRIIRKLIPVFSFFAILLASFLISGSSRAPESMVLAPAPALRSVSVTCRMAGAEISQVLRQISMEANVRIYTGEKLEETVTVSLYNAPLEEALRTVLGGRGYSFRYYRDGVFIEKEAPKRKVAQSGPAMKRVFIAPSFISITKVRDIVNALKSSDAVVSCDERSGVLVLDEKPEKADEIMERIRECDTFSAKTEETASAAHRVTRLFVMKNTPVKDVINEIKAKMTPEGTVFPNENLNSFIATDTLDSLAAIEKLVTMYEVTGGNPVVTIKVMQVPAEVLGDLKKIGYEIGGGEGPRGGEIKFNTVNNRKYFSGILDKYTRFSDQLSADIGDFCEITASYGSASTRIRIAPTAEPEGMFSVRYSAQESVSLDGPSADEPVKFSMTSGGRARIREDQGIVVTGLETGAARSVAGLAAAGFSGYLPALSKLSGFRASEEADPGAGGAPVTLLAIELSAHRNVKGLPKYSFLNLLNLPGDELSAVAEGDAGGAEWKNTSRGYLDMFGRPSDAEERSETAKTKTARKDEKPKLFRIKSAPDGRASSGTSTASADGVIYEDTPENRKTAAAARKAKADLATEMEKNADRASTTCAADGTSTTCAADGASTTCTADEDATVAQINSLIEKGDAARAARTAEEYLESDSGSSKILIAQGKAFKKMNRFVSASNAWKKALKSDPANKKLRESVEKIDGLISYIIGEKSKLPDGSKADELGSYLR